MLCYEMQWCNKMCYIRPWYSMLRNDLFWNKKLYDAHPCGMIWKLCYIWNDFIKGYVCILPSLICDERMGVVLHYLLRHDGKCGDLMYNCIFTCIRILPLYDEYGRVHHKTKMIIMFTMMLQRSLFPTSVWQQSSKC